MHILKKFALAAFWVVTIVLSAAVSTKADALSKWNLRACEIAGPANLDTPTANRMMAIVHTAMYEAVNAITKRYPASDRKIDAPAGASVDAAIAAAARGTLIKMVASKEAEIESAYQASLAAIPDGKSRADGISVGEQAAVAVLSARTD